MMLTDNRNYLRTYYRVLVDQLITLEQATNEKSVVVEQAKTGVPTLKMTVNNKKQYVHSKYDPEKEAQRLVDELQNMEQYEHVLFIGAGLGYHIKMFLQKYPNIAFSIYEPNIEVLHAFLSQQSLMELSIKQLTHIFTSTDEQDLQLDAKKINQSIKGSTYIFTLPVYDNMYVEQTNIFIEAFKKTLQEKRSHLVTNFMFQQRWTINAIKNFPKVLQTPNVLCDIDKKTFQGKPAIIVAAGPALNEEFEHLKYIKEHGLAYIFSVGSAINSLIEHGIYPDAACTYDPSERNQIVFEKLKSLQIKEIPMIFGSPVGYETLENYPGNMLHMLTNQDTIAPRYIENFNKIQVVSDAPSIAVVTFQLLSLLGCNQIILVGQNLAFQNNIRYASGIDYQEATNELSQQEQQNALIVKDVYGNDIQTDDGFNQMRRQLELYIEVFNGVEVINTTKGGAHIKGTVFKPLEDIIQENWAQQTRVVTPNWYMADNQYDQHYIRKQINLIKDDEKQLQKSIQKATQIIRDIHKAVKLNKTKELDKSFPRLDKEMLKIRNNTYFQAFVEPMMRIHNERLVQETKELRFETNIIKKGKAVAHLMAGYLMNSEEMLRFVKPLVDEMKQNVESLNRKDTSSEVLQDNNQDLVVEGQQNSNVIRDDKQGKVVEENNKAVQLDEEKKNVQQISVEVIRDLDQTEVFEEVEINVLDEQLIEENQQKEQIELLAEMSESFNENKQENSYKEAQEIVEHKENFAEKLGTLKGKNILVTGGTGSFGQAIVSAILQQDMKKVIVLSRSGVKSLWQDERVRFSIGDIRDKERLYQIVEDIDIIIHSAAIENVDTYAHNAFEAVKTNIIGTQNVIEVAIQCGVEKVIAIITSETNNPTNIYASTQLVAEQLLYAANKGIEQQKTCFNVIHYSEL